MRSWLTILGTAALGLSLSAVPAVADGTFAGYRGTGEVFLGLGRNYADDSDVEAQAPFLAGAQASAYLPLGGKLSGTVDLFFEYGSELLDDDDNDAVHGGGAIHLNYMQPGRYVLGGVAGVFGGEVLSDDDQTYWLLAAEGKFLFERASLWAQVGYFNPISECHGCYQQWWYEVAYYRGGVNYFLEDDLKLAGDLAYYDGWVEGQDSAPLQLWGIEVEGRFSDQVSAFGRYQYARFINEDEDDPLSQHGIFVGLRVQWGGGDKDTLRANEPYRSIGTPRVGQFIAVSDEFD